MTKGKGNILYLTNIKQRFPTIDWEKHVLIFYLQNQDFPVVSGYFSLFEFNHMPWNPGMCAYQWRGHQPARLAMPSRDVVFFLRCLEEKSCESCGVCWIYRSWPRKCIVICSNMCNNPVKNNTVKSYYNLGTVLYQNTINKIPLFINHQPSCACVFPTMKPSCFVILWNHMGGVHKNGDPQ